MEKVVLAIVGYGGMGSYHATRIIPENQEYITIKGIFDIKAERNDLAKEQGFDIYGSFDELLLDSELDGVLIATPNDCHKEMAIQALRAGKNVICEKPVMMNTTELDEVLAVAEEVNQVFMVHQNRRWDPDFLIIRKLYQEKQIGDIFQLESRVHGANGIPGDWRHLKKHGGGMVLDWGVHLFDQLLFLIDSPIKSVNVDLSYILGDEVDDGFICYMKFENGVNAIVEVGTTNYAKLPRWYIKGTNGSGRIDDWDLSGELVAVSSEAVKSTPAPIQAGVGLTKTMAPPSEDATVKMAFPEPKAEYVSFYHNFYDVLRNNAEPVVKNEEVRKVMQLMDKILEAAR